MRIARLATLAFAALLVVPTAGGAAEVAVGYVVDDEHGQPPTRRRTEQAPVTDETPTDVTPVG